MSAAALKTFEPLPTDEDILTIDDVSKWLHFSKSFVYDHTTRSEPIIPHVRIGGHVRFHRGTVRKWFMEQHGKAA